MLTQTGNECRINFSVSQSSGHIFIISKTTVSIIVIIIAIINSTITNSLFQFGIKVKMARISKYN